MDFIKVKYPSNNEDDWYKFGNLEGSVSIQDKEIEQWVNRCITDIKKQLENNTSCPYSFIASGNTMVIAFFSQDIKEDIWANENYITVIIARDYEEGSFFLGDIKTDNKKLANTTLKELLENTDLINKLELDGYEINITKKEDI